MHKLQIIAASTRPARQGWAVAEWFDAQARAHGKFEVELIDLQKIDLPFFDEAKHPRFADYEHEHTRKWAAIVSRADAYVFVTPEYDFGPPASLINAIQYLVNEWAYKAAGFVSYGGVAAGARGVQITKSILTTVKVMPMFETVAIPFFAQHIDKTTGRFDPGEVQSKAAGVMLDELLKWTGALRGLRA